MPDKKKSKYTTIAQPRRAAAPLAGAVVAVSLYPIIHLVDVGGRSRRQAGIIERGPNSFPCSSGASFRVAYAVGWALRR